MSCFNLINKHPHCCRRKIWEINCSVVPPGYGSDYTTHLQFIHMTIVHYIFSQKNKSKKTKIIHQSKSMPWKYKKKSIHGKLFKKLMIPNTIHSPYISLEQLKNQQSYCT